MFDRLENRESFRPTSPTRLCTRKTNVAIKHYHYFATFLRPEQGSLSAMAMFMRLQPSIRPSDWLHSVSSWCVLGW